MFFTDFHHTVYFIYFFEILISALLFKSRLLHCFPNDTAPNIKMLTKSLECFVRDHVIISMLRKRKLISLCSGLPPSKTEKSKTLILHGYYLPCMHIGK